MLGRLPLAQGLGIYHSIGSALIIMGLLETLQHMGQNQCSARRVLDLSKFKSSASNIGAKKWKIS